MTRLVQFVCTSQPVFPLFLPYNTRQIGVPKLKYFLQNNKTNAITINYQKMYLEGTKFRINHTIPQIVNTILLERINFEDMFL